MPSILERWRLLKKPSVVNVTISGDASTQVLNLSARELYQTQDNLQAVVNFLSNSIAQLPLKVYARDGENERRRDRDSVAAKLLWRPNDDQTEFEFIRGLMVEYFVFGSVYVWVTPDINSDSGYQLRIIPNEWIVKVSGNAYAPDTIEVCSRNGGTAFDIPKNEFVQFKTYSAGNPSGYLSPISALRQTLCEQVEAGKFRRQLWRSSGRLNAQIIRPKDVAPWDDEARKKFATAFREAWGSGGSKAGSIPIMEDGMEIKPFSTSFKESEWAQSVKLSRESVAAAYGVNPSLIWHSDTQTYASAKDNARALYADCLGSVLQMLQQRINTFLIPKVDSNPNLYVEFDLTEKLKGSFEERASILQTSVGAPWLTRNEARSDMNLPPVEGGDDLITPLNVATNGVANPDNGYDYDGIDNQAKSGTHRITPVCACKDCKDNDIKIKGKSAQNENDAVTDVFVKFFERQFRSIAPKINSGKDFWNAERWNKELADDLTPVLQKIADAHGNEASETLDSVYIPELTEKYIRKTAENRAKNINAQTLNRIEKALASGAKASKPKKPEVEDEDEEEETNLDIVEKVYEVRENTAETLGRSAATAIASWAAIEATHQAISNSAPRVVGKIVEKEWITGDNPRPSHLAMNGERVPIDADFSNGQHWVGDDTGDPDESCGCNCSIQVVISRR